MLRNRILIILIRGIARQINYIIVLRVTTSFVVTAHCAGLRTIGSFAFFFFFNISPFRNPSRKVSLRFFLPQARISRDNAHFVIATRITLLETIAESFPRFFSRERMRRDIDERSKFRCAPGASGDGHFIRRSVYTRCIF